MDLSNRYMYLFTCLILSLAFSISSAHAATDISFTASLNNASKSIDLSDILKNGQKYAPTSIKPTTQIVSSSIKKRLAVGGGSLILLAATYYGMTYNSDGGVFEKQAETGQWQWSYQGTTSTSGADIAAAVVAANNANQSQFTYSAPQTSINASGALSVTATRTDNSTGLFKTVTLASIGGTPVTTQPETEIYTVDQLSEALINDAFAVEGDAYFPTADQVVNAGNALLDLYGLTRTTAIQHVGEVASDATDAVKNLVNSIALTQPLSQDTDIKAPAVPDAGILGSLPDFCSWATPICDAITGVKQFIYTPPCEDFACQPPLQTTDLNTPDGVALYSTRFVASSQCPADKVVSLSYLGGRTFAFSYAPLCSFANTINPLIVLIGYLIAGYMFINSLRTM